MEKYIMGKRLMPGDTIGVVAPSSPVGDDADILEKGRTFLENLGYHLVFGNSVLEYWGYLAGSDEQRAADINAAFADPGIDAVLCLRGGYGAARLLDLLDYESIAAHPKQCIGFSDITALHVALRQRCRMASVHGPMLTTLGRRPTAYTLAQFAAGLADPCLPGAFRLPSGHRLSGLVPGNAAGTICGGNIAVLSSLIGTPYELDGSNALLFLEEIGEDAYSIDRMFRQMEQSGLMDRISGIIFGEFTTCGPNTEAPYEFTVRQVIAQYAERWQKPALSGVTAGHGRHNGWLPFGVPASMKADADGTAQLIIHEIC